MAENTKVDSLINLLNTAKEDTNKVILLNKLAAESSTLKNTNNALNYLEEAKLLAEKLNYKTGIANTYNQSGNIYYRIGNLPEAMNNYTLSLRIRENLFDKKGIANSYNNIGLVYWQQGNYPEALKVFTKSSDLMNEIRNIKGIADCNFNIGLIYNEQGNSAEAIKRILNALTLYQKINEKNGIGDAYNNIGIIYLERKEFGEAIKNFQEGLKYYTQTGSTNGMAKCYNNIGLVYKMKENYSEALKYIDLSLELREKLSNIPEIADCNVNKGNIYRLQKNYKAALKSYLNSLKIFMDLGKKERVALTCNNLGQIYIDLKQYDEAKKSLDKALSISREIGSMDDISDCYKSLADLDSTRGNYRAAYENFKMYKIYQDSLVNNETTKKIVQAQMNYEFEKKEAVLKAEEEKKKQQISLLKKENYLKAEIAKKEKQKKNYAIGGMVVLLMVGSYTYLLYDKRKKLSNQLSQSLLDLELMQDKLIQTEKEKEAENIRLRISRDIHDDIGHNLTKIALLSGITETDKNITSSETKITLNKIGNYSREVNASLSEIVWAISPKQDTLKSLLTYMRNHIHKFLDGTGIHYNIIFPETTNDCILHPDLKRNIFLVLKESLNNILKYAKATNLTIIFEIENSRFMLYISDDGQGFNVDEAKEQGNGLSNMAYRMKQSGGEFIIESTPGKGSLIRATGNFDFNFPISII